MSEVLLGVQRFAQPFPKRNPGGDCFACALKAAVDYLFPANPVDFNDAWEAFLTCYYGSDKKEALSNTWSTMIHTAPYALRSKGYNLEVTTDIIYPSIDIKHWSHAWGFSVNVQTWARRAEAWLSAGWVILAECSFDPQPAVTPDGKVNWTDHFIVIDGQRSFWQDRMIGEVKSASLEHETHVVCSAKGSYWINTNELLTMHGVNGIALLRRDEYDHRDPIE